MWLSSQSISTYHYSQLPFLPFEPGPFLALHRFNCCPSDDSNSNGFSQSSSSMICASQGSNLPPSFYKTTQRITLIFKSYNTSTALIQDWILGIKMADQNSEAEQLRLRRFSKENRWYFKTIDGHLQPASRKLLEEYSHISPSEVDSHIYKMV
jgi:hypothetical protein